MNRKLLAAAAALTVFTATAASADDPYAVTPNGRAEAMFDVPAKQASDKVAGACMSSGWVVKDQNPQQVICEAPMTFGQKFLGNLMMGNSYSTDARLYYRFSIVEHTNESRVQANGWMGLQSAFGQDREMDANVDGFHNKAMTLLLAAGGRYPTGTTFPNHAYVGGGFDLSSSPQGLKLRDVDPAGPLGRAGLQQGDVVTRVAGERWKTFDDFFDGLRKAAENPAYEVEYFRDGQKMRSSVEREFKAAVAPLAEPNPPFASRTSGTTVVQAQLSVADELAKFSELLKKGVISQEEFDAQKIKLLAK